MGKVGLRLAGCVVAAMLLAPGTAQGATVIATYTIQGAGTISAVASTSGGLCESQILTNTGVQGCGAIVDSQPFGVGAQVTLTATPRTSGGWVFLGWQGSCSGTGTCALAAAPDFIFPNILNLTARAVFVDLTPPVVNTLTHTFTAVNNQVKFDWTVDDPATYECTLDGGAVFACTKGQAFTLPEGTHTLALTKATDIAGNGVALLLMDSVRVIDTILLSGPSGFQRTKAASFRFRSGSATDYDCRLTKPGQTPPAFVHCGTEATDGTLTIPYTATDLAQDGAYTFEARAKDLTFVDETPLRRTWTIDTVAPNTTLSSPDLPEGVVTTLLNATFSFGSTEPLGTLQCSLDGAPFAACASPRTLPDLAFGSHTFQVRSIDRAGNVDATPAVRRWTVAAKDDDGDGFNQRSDCDDTDPRVHPTARDVPANRKDENCDGKDAQRRRVGGSVATGWSVLGSALTVTRLDALGVGKRTKIQLRCLGSGCTFKRVKAKGKPRNGRLNLLKSLSAGQRVFRAGQTLEVRLTARNRNGTVIRYKLKSGKLPVGRSLCLPPGANKPKRRC